MAILLLMLYSILVLFLETILDLVLLCYLVTCCAISYYILTLLYLLSLDTLPLNALIILSLLEPEI